MATGQTNRHQRGNLTFFLAVLGGLVFGSGGASAYFLSMDSGIPSAKARTVEKSGSLSYIKIQRLTVPMADARGNLTSYVTLDLALETRPGQGEFVKQRIPMIRHQINVLMSLETFGQAGDATRFDIKRATPAMLKSVNKALGTPAIRSLSIVSALPSQS